MIRWGLRVSFVLAFLWIARAHGDVVPVFLGYLLWAYLVVRAWPAMREDFRRIWSAGIPLRESLSRIRPGRDANAGF